MSHCTVHCASQYRKSMSNSQVTGLGCYDQNLICIHTHLRIHIFKEGSSPCSEFCCCLIPFLLFVFLEIGTVIVVESELSLM